MLNLIAPESVTAIAVATVRIATRAAGGER
jgi:hypothetical protein